MDSFVGLFDPETQDEINSNNVSLPNDELLVLNKLESNVSSFPDAFPPEDAEGNVEYKLKLVNPSKSRFEHLVTQMKWRLKEGQGEAIYVIGVADGGMLIGLDNDEMGLSVRTLFRMAQKLGADVTTLREQQIKDKNNGGIKTVAEFLIRKIPEHQESAELRVAVLGNSDVGKSTLLGVLTQGEKDNGRGSARLNLFRHLHEIQTGRTSSISREILGFNSKGIAITYSTCRTAEEIWNSSNKLITFIDLAGHEKYMKTTVFGLTGNKPHFAILVISAVCGLPRNAKKHFELANAIDIPIIFVINKIDMAPSFLLEKTVQNLKKLLRTSRHEKPYHYVFSEVDALNAAEEFIVGKKSPIFLTSCVTGQGINLLYTFLNFLSPSKYQKEREQLIQQPAEFQVDETFQVPDVGVVVSGLLTSGIIREGDNMLVGPSNTGTFSTVKVISLHRHKVPSREVRACENATLALANTDLTLRKGMVLISQCVQPPVCYYFQGKIKVLCKSSIIYPGFQAIIHIGNVRQTVRILGIMGKSSMGENETAPVLFKFMYRPECIHPGSKLLLREGEIKAIGHVTQIFLINNNVSIKTSPIYQKHC